MAVSKIRKLETSKSYPLLIIPVNLFLYFVTVFCVNFIIENLFCRSGEFGCFGAIGFTIVFDLAFILPSVLISYLIYRRLAKVNKIVVDRIQEQKIVLYYLLTIILITLLLFTRS